MIEIIINPGQRKITMPEGMLVLHALKQAEIIIPTVCGGKGTCGKCKVMISPQDTIPDSNERKYLTEEEIKAGFRLACQARLNQDTIVTIPQNNIQNNNSHSNANNKIKSHFLSNNFKPSQQIKKIFIKLAPPTLQDQRPDWLRVKSELEKILQDNNYTWEIPVDILAKIPRLLRDNDFQITLVLLKNNIIEIEPGDTRKDIYGVAFDIGTTTIAGYLLNLSTIQTMAVEASDNPHRIYGDDVISRIDFSIRDFKGKQKLQKKLIKTLNKIIFSLVQEAKINEQYIYMAVIVGNTCMQHFLWALPTENMAISPYIPVTANSILMKSIDLPDFCLVPHAIIYTAPSIAAYVGGDIIADMIDISLWRKTGNILLVDLGTNGEITMSVDGKIWACAAAAGPAFEGARISSGMRADYGAIDRVSITPKKLEYHVIGESKVAGICGSGIIDITAELLKLEIIQPNGRLIRQEECPEFISHNIKERITQGNKFLIASAKESASGHPVYITQKDIREIQLAKGAVAAGVRILLREAQIEDNDIDEIVLTGAFGNIININSAIKIGIIPDISARKIKSIGNAAGQGAEKLLLSEELRDKAEELAKKVCYVELSSHDDFQNIFTNSLYF